MSGDVPVPVLVADLQDAATGHPAVLPWDDAVTILAGHAEITRDEAEKMLNTPPPPHWSKSARLIVNHIPEEITADA
jgi:hypothetical protein